MGKNLAVAVGSLGVSLMIIMSRLRSRVEFDQATVTESVTDSLSHSPTDASDDVIMLKVFSSRLGHLRSYSTVNTYLLYSIVTTRH